MYYCYKEWPGKVWEITASLLEKAQFVVHDKQELNAIIDEFAWNMELKPFTLDYINSESFRKVVIRNAGGYGFTDESDFTSFNRVLNLDAAAAECGIINAARLAREEISIAIDEYVISKRVDSQRSTNLSTPSASLAPATLLEPTGLNIDEHERGRVSSPDTGSHPLSVFRSMDNLKFSEIKINIDPENLGLKISARGRNAAVPFSALELTRKNEVGLNRQGDIFLGMANRNFHSEQRGAVRAISRLSKSLRTAFNTEDSPLSKNLPRFKLSVPKNKEAEKHASRRTLRYDDTRKVSKDGKTQEFLRKNDLSMANS